VDVHALHAYRNWLLAKAAQRLTVTNQTLVKGTSVAPSGRTRIGESRAICRLLESIAHPAVVPAKPPPGVVDGSTRDAVFSLSDGVSLVNDELGYGETVSDTMSFVKGDSLESTTYYSRRTRTGRQRLAAAPQEPPAVSVPEAKLKLP
jgi:hypothetical protein